MKISLEYPPNWSEIKQRFNPPTTAVFTYGDTIFNPHKNEIPADFELHESIHTIQQGKSPSQWWQKYLHNDAFRQDQELEAIASQLLFIKKNWPRVYERALDALADMLSSPMYDLKIDRFRAHSLIRHRIKALSQNLKT